MQMKKNKGGKLRRIEDMPAYLQFNPYIITGYRDMLSTKDSVGSLLYFHNETVNILTHGKIKVLYYLHSCMTHEQNCLSIDWLDIIVVHC